MKPKEYLKIVECEPYNFYEVYARASVVALYIGDELFRNINEKGAFLVARHKFGKVFIDVENHWDVGGTVRPIKQLKKIGDGPLVDKIRLADERYLNGLIKYLDVVLRPAIMEDRRANNIIQNIKSKSSCLMFLKDKNAKVRDWCKQVLKQEREKK